ncbi:MAG TPA: DNA gyrase modulator, partial [Allocoleopsis sp.]
MISELLQTIEALDFPADWVGLRAVKETAGSHHVRDGMPQSNGKSLSEGVMVEVLVEGQIGYGATNSFHPDKIRSAAQVAYQQALAASRWGIHPLTVAVRPKVVGQYTSPYLKPFDVLSPGELNELLIRLCQTLKVSEHIVQANAIAI